MRRRVMERSTIESDTPTPADEPVAAPVQSDAVAVRRRVRDTAERFGLRLLDPANLREIGAGEIGRSLLVGWSRARLAEAEAVSAPTGPDPSESAPCPALPSAELQRRPRRRSDAASRTTNAATGPDRWALVSVVTAGERLAAGEAAMLRTLAAAMEARIDSLATGPVERTSLSGRERECLQWTAAGKTTWEIAGILAISQNTVDGYIASATRKLGAVNRAQAVAEALRRGVID